ncbi:hypothetical protein GDO86_010617, partial [Hymenochirus boettgeri]
MVVNGFIIGTYLLEWTAKKSLHTTDSILLCLDLTRWIWNLISVLWYLPDLTYEVYMYFNAFWIYFNWSSLWFVSLLTVVYCVKITNYNNIIFVYVKTNISKGLKWLILGNLMISLAFTFMNWYIMNIPLNSWNNTIEISPNSTQPDIQVASVFTVSMWIYYLTSCLPFFMFCAAVLLLIASLWSHIRQIKSSETGFAGSHLKAHFSVLEKMVFSFILYIAYFVSDSLSLLSVDTLTVWSILSFTMPPFLSSFYSGFLIYSNTRLKKMFIDGWRK